MSTTPSTAPTPTGPGSLLREALRHDLQAIQGRWIWLVGLGIALIVLGTFALLAPWVATAAVVVTLGVLLVASGILEGVAAFWTRNWSGFFLNLLIAVLYVVAGVFILKRPDRAAATLTLIVGALLLVGGVFKVVAALRFRFPQWGWAVVSGLIGVVLGFMIWSEFQEWTPILLGTLLGIDMIFNGWLQVALGLALRKLPERIETARENLAARLSS
jgi:uncharacterized membrane protein HdeD (DUF308 family)